MLFTTVLALIRVVNANFEQQLEIRLATKRHRIRQHEIEQIKKEPVRAVLQTGLINLRGPLLRFHFILGETFAKPREPQVAYLRVAVRLDEMIKKEGLQRLADEILRLFHVVLVEFDVAFSQRRRIREVSILYTVRRRIKNGRGLLLRILFRQRETVGREEFADEVCRLPVEARRAIVGKRVEHEEILHEFGLFRDEFHEFELFLQTIGEELAVLQLDEVFVQVDEYIIEKSELDAIVHTVQVGGRVGGAGKEFVERTRLLE